jgi:hypothetical protein
MTKNSLKLKRKLANRKARQEERSVCTRAFTSLEEDSSDCLCGNTGVPRCIGHSFRTDLILDKAVLTCCDEHGSMTFEVTIGTETTGMTQNEIDMFIREFYSGRKMC